MDKILIISSIIALQVIFGLCFSWPVWILWNNCLVGALDSVREVSWMQAWGITMLFGFLFRPLSVATSS